MPEKTTMERSAFTAQDGAAEYIAQVASEVRPTSIDSRDAVSDGWICVVQCGEENIELGWMPTMAEPYRRQNRWIKALAFVGRSHMEARDRLRDELTATHEAHREKLTELEQQGMKLSKLGQELAAVNEALRADITKLESNQGGDRGDLMRLLGVAETAAVTAEDENTARALVRIVAGLSSALGVESETLEDDS